MNSRVSIDGRGLGGRVRVNVVRRKIVVIIVRVVRGVRIRIIRIIVIITGKIIRMKIIKVFLENVTVSVSKSESQRHMLTMSEIRYAVNYFAWHRQRCPSMSNNAFASCKAHKIMAALNISSGAQTNCAHSAVGHIIIMLLVSLYISTKLKANVLIKFERKTEN